MSYIKNSFSSFFYGPYYARLSPLASFLPDQSHNPIRRLCYDKRTNSLFLLFQNETIAWVAIDEESSALRFVNSISNLTTANKRRVVSSFDEELSICDLTLLDSELSFQTVLVAITPNGTRYYISLHENMLVLNRVVPSKIRNVERIYSLGNDFVLVTKDGVSVIETRRNHPEVYEEESYSILSSSRAILSLCPIHPTKRYPSMYTARGCNALLCGLGCSVDDYTPQFLLFTQGRITIVSRRKECDFIYGLLQCDLSVIMEYSQHCDNRVVGIELYSLLLVCNQTSQLSLQHESSF